MSPEFLAAVDALSLATTALFNWDEPSERLTRADAERLRKLAAAAEEADADGGDEDLLADACTAIAQLVDLWAES